MNTLYKLHTITVIGLLYATNATAMLAQVARHKTLIESLPTLACRQTDDHALSRHTILSRMPQQHSSPYSSSSTNFAKQRTLEEMRKLQEINGQLFDDTWDKTLHACKKLIVAGLATTGVAAGCYAHPIIVQILRGDTAELAAEIHRSPHLDIAFTSTIATFYTTMLAGNILYLACLALRAKVLERDAAQAAEELQKHPRVDMPEDKN